ncbi:MAG: GxxExxY protein [Chloroflexi bacterium HGW-Chloroflexi-6]|nr:MAG: GxxExxY protein [Chloroflexi bacterium HGW-Chloroflexi-6]
MANLFYKEESYAIVGAAMEVHRTLGWGYLENVYQAALAHEFTLRNIPFEQQKRLPVQYKTVQVGDYAADFVVYGKIIVEIKAISELHARHHAQTINYLTATGFKLGLIINFGADSLESARVVK